MANLETLELTIKANAESASQGIQKLIGSLNFFRTSVGKSVSGLKQLNAELDKLKKSGGLKLPNLSNGVSRTAKTISDATKQAKAIEEWKRNRKPLTISHFRDNDRTEEEQREAFPQWFRKPGSRTWRRNLREANDILRLRNGQMNIASDPSTLKQFFEDSPKKEVKSELMEYLNKSPDYKNLGAFINQNLGIGAKGKSAKDSASVFEQAFGDKNAIKEVKKTAPETAKMLKEEAKAIETVGQSSENASKKGKGFFAGMKDFGKNVKSLLPKFTLLNRTLRIASTMLIRMGVKALFKGAQEGFNNFYEYSKATGGQFATEMDKVFSTWGQIKNQLGASLASVFSAALPVINSIASAAVTAFNYLSQLIALLTGKSTWTRATEQVGNYADAIESANTGKGGGGGGGMKELLANFDELNVITSESGGGGGGGGAAEAAQEVTDAFEEMTQFDSKIRDFVTWLEDHLSLVHGIIASIVASLLGLPLSISIGIGLIVSGIEDSYNAGYDIGKNGLTKDNLLAAVKGALKTMAGGAFIGWKVAGLPGALIGMTIGFSISMVAIAIGMDKAAKEKLYGDIELTAEEIHNEVNKLFKFDDVSVAIEQMRIDHKNLEKAKEELSKQLVEFNKDFSYDVIKLGVNNPESLAKMTEDVENVVKATNFLIKLRQQSIDIGLKLTTQFDDPKEVIKFSDEQWEKLDSYVTGLGEQIGKMLEDGISIDEVATIEKLKKQLNNVTKAITYGEYAGRFIGDIQRGYSGTDWTKVTQNTLEQYTSQYVEAKNDLMDSFRVQAQDTKESLAALYYGMLARNENNPGSVSPEELAKAKRNMETFDIDRDIMDKWLEYGEPGRQIFSQNVSNAFSAVTSRKKDWNYSLANKTVLNGSKKNIREWLLANIAGNIGFDKKILVNTFDAIEFTGWEILGEDIRKRMIYELQKQFGINSSLYSSLKGQLNIPVDDIVSSNNTAWQRWKDKEKLKFLLAITKAYGAPEALAAATKAGMDVTDCISRGMRSTNADVRHSAFEMATIINNEIEKLHPEVKANASLDVKVNALVEVQASFFDKVKQAAVAKQSTVLDNVRTILEKTGQAIRGAATGAYDIPSGDLFIANEQGAELIGSMNGHTTVANQGQIIEGISSGVERANAEQNALLREQNSLLRGILEKETSVNFGASAQFGRTVKRSLDMYNMVGG